MFKPMIKYLALIFISICMLAGCSMKAERTVKAINPDITPEAQRLLEFIYSIEGKYTITGQHNFLGRMSEYTDTIFAITGKYPGLWGSDFGFADSTHDIDNIKYRPLLVSEIVKQHERGSIITLTYHQANPYIGEPCQFSGGVQSKMTEQQWNDLLTDGTPANLAWKKNMDLLAEVLKQLQERHIPVLFRPYHEMNGKWFWWGGHQGDRGFVALWKMLYHYYTDVHKLNNLVWVWSPDKPWHGLQEYYPGNDLVDIVSCDIYPERDTNVVFRPEWYSDIKTLAAGKPIAIGECSRMPSLAELEKQSNYTWFMLWSDLATQHNTVEELKTLFQSERCLTADEVKKMRGF